MEEKMIVLLGIGTIISLIVTMTFFVTSKNIDIIEYVLLGLVLILIFISTIIMRRRVKDIKANMPLEDELTSLNTYKAGHYTFISIIWIAVGLIWYNTFFVDNFGLYQLSTEQALGFVVLISGIIFFGTYFYLSKKP